MPGSELDATRRLTMEGALYGVSVTLVADTPDLLAQMAEWLPPAWQGDASGVAPISFEIQPDGLREFKLLRDRAPKERGALHEVIGSFEMQLRNHVAENAPDHVFIHAGAVSHAGRGIVIPGGSFSGKTTLVRELVRAGATYYSDEYAVIDRSGLLHPYPKPLAIRDDETGYRGKSYHPPERLGASTGVSAVRIGMLVSTQYRRDAVWEPARLTPAEALMELIPHSFPPRERAPETLATLAAAFDTDVIGLRSVRGDAAALAPTLLALLDSA